jgi:hypothetical protein
VTFINCRTKRHIQNLTSFHGWLDPTIIYRDPVAVPNSHNITQTYNTKINKYLELSVAMRNLWCLEKISILPFIISATGIVPQSLFKNLKILDLENTLVVEIQKGILLYSCHIVRKFLNIDTERKTQKSQNVEARRW